MPCVNLIAAVTVVCTVWAGYVCLDTVELLLFAFGMAFIISLQASMEGRGFQSDSWSW